MGPVAGTEERSVFGAWLGPFVWVGGRLGFFGRRARWLGVFGRDSWG